MSEVLAPSTERKMLAERSHSAMSMSPAGFDLDRYWSEQTDEIAQVARLSGLNLRDAFGRLLDLAVASIGNGGKLIFFGNGGSAADAQHLATELAVRFCKDRPPIAALALTTDSSALTAIGNDLGFDRLFERQLEAVGRREDLAIGISTSGRSRNVLLALKKAAELGISPAALSGHDGGGLPGLADPLLIVPSRTTSRIQEAHIALGHMLCGALEQRLDIVPK